MRAVKGLQCVAPCLKERHLTAKIAKHAKVREEIIFVLKLTALVEPLDPELD
jgi:hypothetical protein